MDKRFIKQLICIIKDNDMEEYDYLSKIKYAIFFITKIIYANKLKFCKLTDDYYHISSKDVLNCDGMGIFQLYDLFDLKNKKIESRIYNLICEYCDDLCDGNFAPAKLYELLLTSHEKKHLGQVYTPSEIVLSMLKQTFNTFELNKDIRIMDPSCGGGYFLVEAFNMLKNDFRIDNFQTEEARDKFMLENMIYGIDIDEFSIFLTKMGLLFSSCSINVNFKIFNMDFLLDSKNIFGHDTIGFDIIIGNPPYIGHKQLDKAYRSLLTDKFGDVFYDKSDISYCFFRRAKDFLKDGGVICFITSRYFMEALYADKLRKFLKESFHIISINDYSGIRVFKGAMVSPLVITLHNKISQSDYISYTRYNTDVNAPDKIDFSQNKLKNSGWIILNSIEENLFNRIEAISNTYIKDVCNIKQGIITGLDKAFIVTEHDIEKYHLEESLLKKWIKNSNITKTEIKYGNMYLIYSNLIENEADYPNVIKYLLPYKPSLMNRRECKIGTRKWYELQWGRILSDFEAPKILFPYKAKENNFCYDTNKYYCSADVYFINEISSNLSYDYLQKYLNSNIFEFYFKCNAKKVGVGIFEYYPNKLNSMKIYIPDGNLDQKLSPLGNFSIDNFLEKVFNITGEEEKAIISKYALKKGDNAK